MPRRLPPLLAVAFAALASRPAAAAPNADPHPTPASKKGLQVQMADDALALGIAHAALNVNLTQLVEPAAKPDSVRWTFQGRPYTFSPATVANLDTRVRELSAKGVVVNLILLPYVSNDPARDALMVHPAYARGERHAGPIGMFNVATPDGVAWLWATAEFLAHRYSGADPARGRVWGYIVGNEVNSHWFWANMGRSPAAAVIDAYERAVRIVHGAVRTASANARVYLSLDHFWAVRYPAGDDRQAVPGRDFLIVFAAAAAKRGDFDWHVAYHPYPEPLGECRFWLDRKNAPLNQAARTVTFKNLEVLTSLLATPGLRANGRPRRVILSEQGFHCADRPDGERDQAAAFAFATVKVQQTPEVDAFILHRHVDHAGEGGLRLGLWTTRSKTGSEPDRKRAMYDVFRAAGTPAQERAFAFALPVIGVRTWDEALALLAK